MKAYNITEITVNYIQYLNTTIFKIRKYVVCVYVCEMSLSNARCAAFLISIAYCVIVD